MKANSTRESPRRMEPLLKLLGAILLVAGAVWFVIGQLRTPVPKMNTKAFESLGTFAADEAGKLLGHSGTIQLVSAVPDQNMAENDHLVRSLATLVPQLAAFKTRMQQQGKFVFLPELKLPQPTGAQATAWPVGKLGELLEKTPPNAAIVLFCSLPGALNEAERQSLRQRSGKTILAGVLEMEARRCLKEKLVQLAIAARIPVPPKTTATETPTEWVRRVYQAIGPEPAEK